MYLQTHLTCQHYNIRLRLAYDYNPDTFGLHDHHLIHVISLLLALKMPLAASSSISNYYSLLAILSPLTFNGYGSKRRRKEGVVDRN